MYKITYSLDGENRVQTSREFRGYVYGELYLSKAAVRSEAEWLSCEIDEDGGCYMSPIDYWVEEATPHDFVTRRQCIVSLCQRCGSDIINNDMLPFPPLPDGANLTREWLIDADDFGHDPGCLWRAIKDLALPPQD